ncbi:MAG: response regulator [Planctomycetaceae bacterium]
MVNKMGENLAPELFELLVIEDNGVLRRAMCGCFKKKLPGIRTIEAGDADQAIRILRNGTSSSAPKPDVIVSDLRLPRISGGTDEIHADLVDLLRQQRGRVILISDFVDEPDVRAAIEQTEGLADSLISKRSQSFEDNLVRRIRAILVKLASDRIIYRFQRIYSPDAFPSEGAEEMGSVSPMSHVLRSEQEAIDYWPYLNDEAQELVQRYYAIVRMDDGTVGLRSLGLGGGGSR